MRYRIPDWEAAEHKNKKDMIKRLASNEQRLLAALERAVEKYPGLWEDKEIRRLISETSRRR